MGQLGWVVKHFCPPGTGSVGTSPIFTSPSPELNLLYKETQRNVITISDPTTEAVLYKIFNLSIYVYCYIYGYQGMVLFWLHSGWLSTLISTQGGIINNKSISTNIEYKPFISSKWEYHIFISNNNDKTAKKNVFLIITFF